MSNGCFVLFLNARSERSYDAIVAAEFGHILGDGWRREVKKKSAFVEIRHISGWRKVHKCFAVKRDHCSFEGGEWRFPSNRNKWSIGYYKNKLSWGPTIEQRTWKGNRTPARLWYSNCTHDLTQKTECSYHKKNPTRTENGFITILIIHSKPLVFWPLRQPRKTSYRIGPNLLKYIPLIWSLYLEKCIARWQTASL